MRGNSLPRSIPVCNSPARLRSSLGRLPPAPETMVPYRAGRGGRSHPRSAGVGPAWERSRARTLVSPGAPTGEGLSDGPPGPANCVAAHRQLIDALRATVVWEWLSESTHIFPSHPYKSGTAIPRRHPQYARQGRPERGGGLGRHGRGGRRLSPRHGPTRRQRPQRGGCVRTDAGTRCPGRCVESRSARPRLGAARAQRRVTARQ